MRALMELVSGFKLKVSSCSAATNAKTQTCYRNEMANDRNEARGSHSQSSSSSGFLLITNGSNGRVLVGVRRQSLAGHTGAFQIVDASSNSQLSELRRCDFIRRAPMPALRIEARHHCVRIVLRHAVHRQ